MTTPWTPDKTAIHILLCAGVLCPGETPSANLRAYVGELMERCQSIDDAIAALLPRYPVEMELESGEELTLP